MPQLRIPTNSPCDVSWLIVSAIATSNPIGTTRETSSGSCAEPAYYEYIETACDWLDNDCDGEIDEGCPSQ